MNVRELIVELLECELEATVDLDIDTKEESINTSDFDLHYSGNYVTLTIEPKDYVLLDKKEYEEMKNRLAELEDN